MSITGVSLGYEHLWQGMFLVLRVFTKHKKQHFDVSVIVDPPTPKRISKAITQAAVMLAEAAHG